jgi:hypothetical protein
MRVHLGRQLPGLLLQRRVLPDLDLGLSVREQRRQLLLLQQPGGGLQVPHLSQRVVC